MAQGQVISGHQHAGHQQNIGRPPKTRSVVTFVLWCLAITIALTIWISQESFYSPTPPTVSTLNQIMSYVDKHPNSAVGGAVVIPANLASESVTWRAYITKNGTDSYVFVPSWVGRKTAVPFTGHTDNWVEGYLYSAKPLQTMGNSSEHPTLDLNVPAETSPEHAQIDRQTRNVTMNIVKHVGNNWYLVTLAQ